MNMDRIKKQARALSERLQKDGVEISHSLALECLAAQHGYPNWDTFCAVGATTKPNSVADAVQNPAGENGLEQLLGELRNSNRIYPASSKRIARVIEGVSGSGKTVLATGLATVCAQEFGWTVVNVPCEPLAWLNRKLPEDAEEQMEKDLFAQVEAAETGKLLLIIDEPYMLTRRKTFTESFLLRLILTAFQRDADLLFCCQDIRDLAAFDAQPEIVRGLNATVHYAIHWHSKKNRDAVIGFADRMSAG